MGGEGWYGMKGMGKVGERRGDWGGKERDWMGGGRNGDGWDGEGWG